MGTNVELAGLALKPTTHCIITSIDASPEVDVAANDLIAAIERATGRLMWWTFWTELTCFQGRIFHIVKDVVWMRNVSFHSTFNETQARIPIMVSHLVCFQLVFLYPSEGCCVSLTVRVQQVDLPTSQSPTRGRRGRYCYQELRSISVSRIPIGCIRERIRKSLCGDVSFSKLIIWRGARHQDRQPRSYDSALTTALWQAG